MSQRVIQKGNEVESESRLFPIQQQHRRLNVRVPIRVSSIDPEVDPETGKPFFCISEDFSSNLSSGGAFIVCSDAVTPGRRVLIEIDIPSGSSVQTVAQVVWKRAGIVGPTSSPGQRPGFGVRFMTSNRQHLAALDRYLASALTHRTTLGTSVTNPRR